MKDFSSSRSMDDRVRVIAYHPADHAEQTGRSTARQRRLDLMDAAAANAERLGVSDDEINAVIVEARNDPTVRKSSQEV